MFGVARECLLMLCMVMVFGWALFRDGLDFASDSVLVYRFSSPVRVFDQTHVWG
jgi:hypothetical protein